MNKYDRYQKVLKVIESCTARKHLNALIRYYYQYYRQEKDYTLRAYSQKHFNDKYIYFEAKNRNNHDERLGIINLITKTLIYRRGPEILLIDSSR